MLELTFSSLAWLDILAGFVEFNTFNVLACYPPEMENMLSQLNVRAESEEIWQFPYCYHDNGPPKDNPESVVMLGVACYMSKFVNGSENGVVKRKNCGIN